MGTEQTSEPPRAQAHHVADPLIEVDLRAELDTLRASASYQGAADHAAKTIAKHGGIRVVLIALKAGGEMREHEAGWPITVQGLGGRVEFTVDGRSIALTPGRLLAVEAGMPHRVTGIDESALLLTIGGQHRP